ncbi:MAG TPA: helix-turn-helix domain-containing protein [Candidatus Dormibacteraeota bacterium]|nr:helix-turn-helix domain-containing protein [Candidatus Dormibacteraeota bacterium]
MAKKPVVDAPAPRLLPIAQAAAFLGTTTWCMRKLVWEKEIAHIRLGQRLLFDIRDLESFITAQKVPAAA